MSQSWYKRGLTVEKAFKYEIEGEAAVVLQNLMECARQHLVEMKPLSGPAFFGEWNTEQYEKMRGFLEAFFS